MAARKPPLPFVMVTDLRSDWTFILEPSRRGARKLNASAMSAHGPGADFQIPYRTVPLYIRRAAKERIGQPA